MSADILIGGILAGGFAVLVTVLTSVLTARHMMGVADRQIEATRSESQVQSLREERRARVADLRTLLSELASTAARLAHEGTVTRTANNPRIEALKREVLASAGAEETPQNIKALDDLIKEQITDEEDRPGRALVDLIRITTRGQSLVLPGPVASAWDRLVKDWILPTTAAVAVKEESLTGGELAALREMLDDVHEAVDRFVVDGRTAE